MLKGYNPGRMDQRITLLQPTVHYENVTNAPVTLFSEAGNVRAERMFRNSAERFEANQQVGSTMEEFRIRDYSSIYTITQKWRFSWNSVVYTIKGVEKVGRRNYLILTGEALDHQPETQST